MDIMLTISLLASNRRGALIRCLDSLKPLLAKIPCELVIVFTGTDKDVRKIAEAYTSHIIDFPWCADFSAARNAGLREAQGEWFLYIDDDEWFEDVGEICRFFQGGEHRRYSSAHYIQRNYQNWNGTEYSDFSAFRMVRRVPGTCFQNPIHEELAPRMEPCKYFQAYVHHYGYVKGNKGRPQYSGQGGNGSENTGSGKTSRNLTLLLQDIRKRPSFIKNYLQAAKEYGLEGDLAKAEEYCRRGRKLCGHSGDRLSKGWLQAYLSYLLSKGAPKPQSIAELEGILAQEHPCELVRLVLYQHLIQLCTRQGQPEKAVQYGTAFEQLLEKMDKDSSIWEQQGYGEFNESYVKSPERLYAGRADCVSSSLRAHSLECARYFLGLLPWGTEEILCRYYPTLECLKGQYGTVFTEMLSDVADTLEASGSGLPVYLLFQRAQDRTGPNGAPGTDKQELYAYCMEHTADPYLQSLLLRDALPNQIGLSPLACRMDLGTWEKCTAKAVEGISLPEQGQNLQADKKLKGEYPLHALCLEGQLLEQRLLKSYYMWDELTGTLKRFCTCILSYYQGQYREEMFTEENLSALPKKCRFAMSAMDAMAALEEGRMAEGVRLFHSSLQLYPPMTGVARELLRQAVRRAEDPALHAGEEFLALAGQMKGALVSLMDAGDTVQAGAVLGQLLELLPEDLELIHIRQELIRRTNL